MPRCRFHGLDLGDELFGFGVLFERFVQHRVVAGYVPHLRVEDLLLDQGVNGERLADALSERRSLLRRCAVLAEGIKIDETFS
jgi:hypothetical protein